jgi:hypothetical protein
MGQQKEHKPDQQSGGSGRPEEQPQRRDQTNPAQQSDRDREQKGGQGGREKRQDQAQPGERQNPERSDQGGRTGEQSGSRK